jgi:glyoxalase family protein
MTSPVSGLHHVTAIASDPQANIDFYAGLLGLRLVKKTVNFDDPSAYHLYYGDASGAPGTIVTFFYWPGSATTGRVGSGQMTRISFSAPPASLDFWQERLQRHEIETRRETRFGETVLTFADPDGIPVEIVAVEADERPGWSGSDLPAAHALRGLHTAELTVRGAALTEQLLTREMDFRLVRREGKRARFESGPGGPGTFADVIEHPSPQIGRGGVGTIHHLAWRVPGDAAQLAMQTRLDAAGLAVSDVRDRTYFRSIYYREHGGILFEIATDVPGFAVDEPVATLGSELKLPPQFEKHRSQLIVSLPPLHPARQYA